MFGQPLPSRDPGLRAAAPATRLQAALAAWEIQAHRTLAARPDSADLVRVARVQALITSTTSIVTEAAATIGQIDRDLFQRLAPTLEANQVAWSRLAKRWGELTSSASRTDHLLVVAAGEVRAAIAATATSQTRYQSKTPRPAAPPKTVETAPQPACSRTGHSSTPSQNPQVLQPPREPGVPLLTRVSTRTATAG
jgi:hypothetical protein